MTNGSGRPTEPSREQLIAQFDDELGRVTMYGPADSARNTWEQLKAALAAVDPVQGEPLAANRERALKQALTEISALASAAFQELAAAGRETQAALNAAHALQVMKQIEKVAGQG